MPQIVIFWTFSTIFFDFFLQKMLFYLYLRIEKDNLFYSHIKLFKKLHYEQD